MSGWWIPVLVASALAFGTKLAGYLVPARWLERAVVQRCATLLPVALLAGLVATSTVVLTTHAGARFALDARLAGLAAAAAALVLRAPFIVVVVVAAAAAAGVRSLGWG